MSSSGKKARQASIALSSFRVHWPWYLMAVSGLGLILSIPLTLRTFGASAYQFTGEYRHILKLYAFLGPMVVLFLLLVFVIGANEILKKRRALKESLARKREQRRAARKG